jgi:GTP cyclohydrolase I
MAEVCGAGCEVVVVVDSAHMCMVARGVEQHASSTMTIARRGDSRTAEAGETPDLLQLMCGAVRDMPAELL